jgi:hypothetical protein
LYHAEDRLFYNLGQSQLTSQILKPITTQS